MEEREIHTCTYVCVFSSLVSNKWRFCTVFIFFSRSRLSFINCSEVYGEDTWLSSSVVDLAAEASQMAFILHCCVFWSPWPAASPWPKSLMFIFVTLCTHSIASKTRHFHDLLYSISEVLLWLMGAAHIRPTRVSGILLEVSSSVFSSWATCHLWYKALKLDFMVDFAVPKTTKEPYLQISLNGSVKERTFMVFPSQINISACRPFCSLHFTVKILFRLSSSTLMRISPAAPFSKAKGFDVYLIVWHCSVFL